MTPHTASPIGKRSCARLESFHTLIHLLSLRKNNKGPARKNSISFIHTSFLQLNKPGLLIFPQLIQNVSYKFDQQFEEGITLQITLSVETLPVSLE